MNGYYFGDGELEFHSLDHIESQGADCFEIEIFKPLNIPRRYGKTTCFGNANHHIPLDMHHS